MTILITALLCTVVGYGAGLLIRTLPTPRVFRSTAPRHSKETRA